MTHNADPFFTEFVRVLYKGNNNDDNDNNKISTNNENYNNNVFTAVKQAAWGTFITS